MTPYLHPRDLLLIQLNLQGRILGIINKEAGFSEGTNFLLFATDTYWYHYYKQNGIIKTWPLSSFKDLNELYFHVI